MKKIDYQFNDHKLLKEALTHPSISYIKEYRNSYERLEFLGDTVLGMVVAEMLFSHFSSEAEGGLSKRHIELVKGTTLAKMANNIGLGEYIVMSQGEMGNGGAENIKNLENVMEALIGAIYIDGGFEYVKKFIVEHWMPMLLEMESPPENTKSMLQEWAQQRGLPIPVYKMVNCIGPAHSPIFSIEVTLPGLKPAIVEAKNKRMGEQEAAKLMLKDILASA